MEHAQNLHHLPMRRRTWRRHLADLNTRLVAVKDEPCAVGKDVPVLMPCLTPGLHSVLLPRNAALGQVPGACCCVEVQERLERTALKTNGWAAGRRRTDSPLERWR